jgi:hypothetical protein
MGNPLTPNLPPTDVTVSDVTENEVDFRAQAKQTALGLKDGGWGNSFWASFWGSVKDGVLWIVTEFVGTVDEIMAFVAPAFLKAQGENNESFYKLSGAILEDLTGVPVDTAPLIAAGTAGDRLKAMQIFGGDLYKLLEDEFAAGRTDLEASDNGAAKRFLGFLMNFAIRQGNIELLASMIPEEIRVADGFRAYGELMAKNLGLGRMARRALQPLIQILVSDPLTYQLQETYRPKRIGPMPAIKKFFRSPDFEAQMRKELAQEGYSDARTNDLIDEMRPLNPEHIILKYLFLKGNTDDLINGSPTSGARDLLIRRGYTPDDVEVFIQGSRPTLEKDEIALLFTHGIIEHDIAITFLNHVGFDTDTAQLVLQAHSLTHSQQRKLGLNELKKAFHNSVIDLLELKAHLTQQGYSDDDIQIITLDLLQPTTGKVRQLSLAEIKAGFKAGVLTEQQASQHLKALGYSDADVAVLIATLPGPKGTPVPVTPPAPPHK